MAKKTVDIEVVGIDNAIRHLKLKNDKIDKATREALTKAGYILLGEVKRSIAGQKAEMASVDTGRFLNSITMVDLDGAVSIESDVDYSVYLEYGTSKIKPRKHFRNSLNRVKDKIPNEFKTEIKSVGDR